MKINTLFHHLPKIPQCVLTFLLSNFEDEAYIEKFTSEKIIPETPACGHPNKTIIESLKLKFFIYHH